MTNVAGATKKATTSGAIWIGYNIGNIVSSYSVVAAEQPVKYRSAWITVIIGMAFTSVASLVLRWMYIRENKRRDLLEAENARAGMSREGASEGKEEEAVNDGTEEIEGRTDYDYTDKERLQFRYST
jgi:flagellar biosynthesis/type III secretory pathway M-ring protein FliF/YscJ